MLFLATVYENQKCVYMYIGKYVVTLSTFKYIVFCFFFELYSIYVLYQFERKQKELPETYISNVTLS